MIYVGYHLCKCAVRIPESAIMMQNDMRYDSHNIAVSSRCGIYSFRSTTPWPPERAII